jgi:hypothetical protein
MKPPIAGVTLHASTNQFTASTTTAMISGHYEELKIKIYGTPLKFKPR